MTPEVNVVSHLRDCRRNVNEMEL